MAMTRKSRWAGMKLVVSSPFFFINSYRSADTICVPSSKFISLQTHAVSTALITSEMEQDSPVLEEIVQNGQNSPLAPLDTIQYEDSSTLGRAARSRVDVDELSTRADLPSLLQLTLSDVAMETDNYGNQSVSAISCRSCLPHHSRIQRAAYLPCLGSSCGSK